MRGCRSSVDGRLAAIAAAALALLPCAPAAALGREPAADPRVRAAFGRRALDVVAGSERAEAFQVEPRPPRKDAAGATSAAPAAAIGDYPIVGGPRPIEAPLLAELKRVLM